MDWSKAKTILIIAFIITNIILGLVIFSVDKHEDATLKEDFIEEVEGLLVKKDISIDTQIPREVPFLNTLTVEYEVLDFDSVNKDFFNGEGIVDLKVKDLAKILRDNENISISNRKIIKYENNDDTLIYKDLDKDKVKDIAMKFLKDKNFDTSDMEVSFINQKEDSYIVEFSKIFNERYLEIAYTLVEVDRVGVRSLERLWLDVLSEGDNPIYISTAPKSILELLSREDVYGKTIVDISLSYYFEPTRNDYIQKPKDARRGKSIPAWRVLFDDGYKVIIDNY